MSEIQKYSFNYEDYGRFRDIGSDGSAFKNARKAKLQKLNIESTIYGLVFPAPAQGQAAEAAEVAAPANGAQAPKYIITFNGTNNNDININTGVIKTIVEAQKDVLPTDPSKFKNKLKNIIEELTKENKTADLTANTPLKDELDENNTVKRGIQTIILEAYVHQNVIKILTIVYAYFVLIEITSGKVPQGKPEVPPQPLPLPKPIEDIINPDPQNPDPQNPNTVLTAFFGNLFDPFAGNAEYVAELERISEGEGIQNGGILGQILRGEPITTILSEKTDSNHPVYKHLRTGKVTYHETVPTENKGDGYDAAVNSNIASLKTALVGADSNDESSEKMKRARALAGLLRRMQYFRAKKGFGQGGPSAAANNDLLKFVLDTFPLFTKMSTDDVDIVNTENVVKSGGKILKKKH